MQRTRVATTFLTVLLAAVLATGCSDDDGCEGMAYHTDLAQDGAETPIGALEAWLGGHEGLPQPPDEGWVVVDSGDDEAAEVVLTNEDGDGWWVSAARTTSGGWIVDEATADAAACGDELP